MSFGWPHALWLLALPLALLARELTRRRAATAAAHPKILRADAGAASLRLASRVAAPAAPARVRPWLCAGLALAILALARPQWGRLEEPVFDQSREILLAIDLSRSMLAPDVKPSRLDRAKLLIQALLEKLEGERVGLVVFAGTAFLQSPLSADYEILREFLPALGPDFLPQGGSNYGALLEASLQAFSATNASDRFLVVLSDGEATDDEWRSRLAELKNKNVRVLGLGIGTAEGAMIPDSSGGLVKDERGAVVLSKLESSTLQQLASTTGGVYRDASAWVDLAALVNATIEAGRKGQFVEKNTIRLVERYQWPLAFAVWCLLVSVLYEFPVRPRVRDLRLGAVPHPMPTPPPVVGKTAGAATTATAALLLLAALAHPVSSFAAATRATPAPAASNASAAAPAAPAAAEESPLAKIVGRLSSSAAPTGRDWAEFARETVTWGSRLQSGQQPVPEGPVRDALAAVAAGAKLDPKTADWTKLREELEQLLEKKDDKQEQPPPQDQQKQDDPQQQQQQQQKKDQQKQKQDPSQKQQDKPEEQKNEPQDPSQDQQPQQPPDEKKEPGESAFGDMNKKDQPPPPPRQPEDNMQKVGGAEKQAQQQPDPALALPLQKLEQLRNQDSPAQLFHLMEGDKKPAKKPTKDW